MSLVEAGTVTTIVLFCFFFQCESLSYEEILLTRAPLSATRINIDNEAKVNCPKDNLPGVTRTPKFRPQKQKQHYIQNKVSQATPRNTSRVNKLVRAEIKRQCTMPSYTVMKGGVGESSEQSQPTDEKKSATESVNISSCSDQLMSLTISMQCDETKIIFNLTAVLDFLKKNWICMDLDTGELYTIQHQYFF